jgi:hypothetical protein
MSVDELALQEAGRDLRPDTITPAAGMTSTDAALIAAEEEAEEGEPPVEDDSPISPTISATEVSAPEVSASTAPVNRVGTNDEKDAATDEQQDASGSAE